MQALAFRVARRWALGLRVIGLSTLGPACGLNFPRVLSVLPYDGLRAQETYQFVGRGASGRLFQVVGLCVISVALRIQGA